jgi:hypothetical protein
MDIELSDERGIKFSIGTTVAFVKAGRVINSRQKIEVGRPRLRSGRVINIVQLPDNKYEIRLDDGSHVYQDEVLVVK